MASKYMEGDVKIVDLIGDDVMKAATTVQVSLTLSMHA